MDEADVELYEKHGDELIRFATVLVGPAHAEDTLAEAAMRAFAAPTWPQITDRRAYLFRAVLNQARQQRRADRRRQLREIRASDNRTVTELSPDRAEVLAALSRLTHRQRAVVFFTYWQDLEAGEGRPPARHLLKDGAARADRVPPPTGGPAPMTHDPTRGQTTQLDTEIRRAVSELVDLAPLPPPLGPEAVPSGRKPSRALAVTVLLFALVVGLAAAAMAVVRTPGDRAEQPSGPSVGPTTTRPPPTPTLVGPANPPARLQLALGGTATQSGGPDALLLADATGNKTARLLFTAPTGRAGCTTGQQVTTTSVAGGARRGPPATQGPQPSLADARWQSTGEQWGALHWCDDSGRELNVVTKGLTETDARALAATVRASPVDPRDVEVDPPAGFVVGRELPSTRTSRLLYERTGSPSPRLEVTIQSAWTTHLQLLAATAEKAELLQLGGRSAVALTVRPGKKTPDTYVVLWDDATLVTLRGEGLTDAQLRAAAADLSPVDPARAPQDPDRVTCDRLGLCG